MSKNKQLVAGFIILVMSVLLAACGSGDSNDSETDTDTAKSDETYEIGTVVKLSGAAWFDRMKVGIEDFSEDTGHETFQQGPQDADAALQVQIVEDLIAQQVDAITIVPFSAESLEPVLKKAREADIVVITHEGEGMENIDYNIEAFNNEDYGEFLMDNLAESMGEEGEYMTTVGSITSNSHMEWVEAAYNKQQEDYPNMTPVETEVETSEDLEKASEKLKEVLKAHPDLEGFQGSSGVDVVGAGQALEDLGIEDQISVVGTSVPSVSRQYIENGSIDSIAFWDPADAGYVMNTLAVMILDGEEDEIEEGLDLGIHGYESLIVDGKNLYGDAAVKGDKENIDEYDF